MSTRLWIFSAASWLLIAACTRAQNPGYTDTPRIPGSRWRVHDAERPVPPIVDPGDGVAGHGAGSGPPADAVVLFDGEDLSGWTGAGGRAQWKVENGYMQVNGTGDIRSREQFGDCQLHVEWATPAAVSGTSQERGNSGVFLMGRYEIQILDSFQNRTYADGQAGAVYGQSPPLVNASRPPGEWQTYDIVFRAPRFGDRGELLAAAYVTVFHNGVLVQNHTEVLGPTRHRQAPEYEPHDPTGPLQLQDHGNPVRYRNIWVRPLEGSGGIRFPAPLPSRWPTAEQTRELSVLLFSKTAAFRHASIGAGIACFERLAERSGFALETTEDAAVFEAETLAGFDVLVFLNTTGDVLDRGQEQAMRTWYQAGGAFVGVHSATDTEYGWDWYGELAGARFASHPPVQWARNVIHDRNHPATNHLGEAWTRRDEWYDFEPVPGPGTRILMSIEEQSYTGGRTGRPHPVAWCREFDGGRTIYTAGGHTAESFSDPAFEQHLLGALLWAAGLAR